MNTGHHIQIFDQPFYFRLEPADNGQPARIVLLDSEGRKADEAPFSMEKLVIQWPENAFWPKDSFALIKKYLNQTDFLSVMKNSYPHNLLHDPLYYEKTFRATWMAAVDHALARVRENGARRALLNFLDAPI